MCLLQFICLNFECIVISLGCFVRVMYVHTMRGQSEDP
jgi:hypothetical protein